MAATGPQGPITRLSSTLGDKAKGWQGWAEVDPCAQVWV